MSICRRVTVGQDVWVEVHPGRTISRGEVIPLEPYWLNLTHIAKIDQATGPLTDLWTHAGGQFHAIETPLEILGKTEAELDRAHISAEKWSETANEVYRQRQEQRRMEDERRYPAPEVIETPEVTE